MRSKKRRELLKIENLTLKIQVFWLRRLKIASSAGSPLCEALRAKVKNYLTILYPDASKPIVDGFWEVPEMFNGSL